MSVELKNISTFGNENDWLGDSAASKHMSYHRERFNTFTKIENSNISVQIEDDSYVQVKGIGTIKILSRVNGQWEPRTLEDTYYVSGLRKNLFSIGAATSKNLKVTFDDKKMEVYSDRLLATGMKGWVMSTSEC